MKVADAGVNIPQPHNDSTTKIPQEHGKDEVLHEGKGDHTHFLATITLCWCALTHAWLLISVFPYSGFMAVDLVDGLTEETAGSYAGLIAAAFMIGRAFSSYGWGKVADCYGRKSVMNMSLMFSMIFSILFGLSPTFGFALLWRFLLGMSNAIDGTAKTMVSEIALGNDTLEAKSMGLVMGMWAWGFLFSPALSGVLAEPMRQYPNAVPEAFQSILAKFPFVLPNLLSGVFCFIGIMAVHNAVPETLPSPRIVRCIPSDVLDWLSKKTRGQAIVSQPAVVANQELSTLLPNEINDEAANQATIKSLWSQRNTRNHLSVDWVFSFVAIALEEAFPLYCISRDSGLGLSEATIGKVLSSSGLLFALSQYAVYSHLVDRVGLRRSMQIGVMLSGPLLIFIPISRQLNLGAPDDSLLWTAFVFLSGLLTCYRVFSLCFFCGIAVATNRTVLLSHRGTLNGLSMLGGSVVKALSPIFAGTLVAFSTSSGVVAPEFGGFVIFVVIGLLGAATVVMTFCMLDEPRPPQPQERIGDSQMSDQE